MHPHRSGLQSYTRSVTWRDRRRHGNARAHAGRDPASQCLPHEPARARSRNDARASRHDPRLGQVTRSILLRADVLPRVRTAESGRTRRRERARGETRTPTRSRPTFCVHAPRIPFAQANARAARCRVDRARRRGLRARTPCRAPQRPGAIPSQCRGGDRDVRR